LAKEGAKVVISSRKQNNVDKAVELLRKDKLECHGLVCHVGKESDRKALIDAVYFSNVITFESIPGLTLIKNGTHGGS
jgi:hypothetical protein